MNRLLPYTAAIPLMIVAAPLCAAEVTLETIGPIVELSITEQVKTRPDIVDIGAGVTTQARTAVAAMQANANEMTAVIARIRALGIDEDDIQTSGINLNARYDYDQSTQRQVFRGYSVSNRVSVTLRDVERTGPVLDALVAAGATDLSGPTFRIDDDTVAKERAREAAMETALKRARSYAGMAGYSGVKLLSISETVRSEPRIMVTAARTQMAADEAATPVQPGLVATGVTVNVTYQMTR